MPTLPKDVAPAQARLLADLASYFIIGPRYSQDWSTQGVIDGWARDYRIAVESIDSFMQRQG